MLNNRSYYYIYYNFKINYLQLYYKRNILKYRMYCIIIRICIYRITTSDIKLLIMKKIKMTIKIQFNISIWCTRNINAILREHHV